jgi:predicted RNA binding protein YcfA (HicA-like mRNA interferase family)
MHFAALTVKDKHMKKLIKALRHAGMDVSATERGHIRVVNSKTHQQVVISSGRTRDRRTVLEIYKDLRSIGFDAKEQGISIG